MESRIDKLKTHYNPRLKKFSETYQIHDWESREAQTARFRVLFDNIPLEGMSILDIGCGCGDLYTLLLEAELDIDYTGIDILPGMVDKALSLHKDARFLCGDLFSDNKICNKKYDVIYTSGIFNLNLGNNADFFKRAVETFTGMAEKYIVITLLDEASPGRDDTYYYFNPQHAASAVKNAGWNVSVIKGYLANDFTLICSKPYKSRA
jgi:cyclopropane fatty-acyl-phospholipid synthase-like methyltransferase